MCTCIPKGTTELMLCQENNDLALRTQPLWVLSFRPLKKHMLRSTKGGAVTQTSHARSVSVSLRGSSAEGARRSCCHDSPSLFKARCAVIPQPSKAIRGHVVCCDTSGLFLVSVFTASRSWEDHVSPRGRLSVCLLLCSVKPWKMR